MDGYKKEKGEKVGKEIQEIQELGKVSQNFEWQKENTASSGISSYLLVAFLRESLTDGNLLLAKQSCSVSSVSFTPGI